jgi:hypothetical protein
MKVMSETEMPTIYDAKVEKLVGMMIASPPPKHLKMEEHSNLANRSPLILELRLPSPIRMFSIFVWLKAA